MSAALVVSNLLLWCVIVVLGVVVAALVRQLGVLNERIAPAGALSLQEGARVGEAAPRIAVESLAGAAMEIGRPRSDGRATLLFFLSPSCPVCKTLLPALQSLGRHEASRLEVVLACDGDAEAHRRFVAEEKLERIPYVLSPGLGIAYGVSKLPFAALVDAAGVLRSRGLVNTREHLESLLEALALGVGSIQEFLEGEGLSEPSTEMSP